MDRLGVPMVLHAEWRWAWQAGVPPHVGCSWKTNSPSILVKLAREPEGGRDVAVVLLVVVKAEEAVVCKGWSELRQSKARR